MKDLEVYLNRYGTGVNGMEAPKGYYHCSYIDDALVKAIYENCEDDGMMTRICNGLMRNNVLDIDTLKRTHIEDLRKIRNFGSAVVQVLINIKNDNLIDIEDLTRNGFYIRKRSDVVGSSKRIREILNGLGCTVPDLKEVQFCTPADVEILPNKWLLLYADLTESAHFILVNYQSISTPFSEIIPRIAVVNVKHHAIYSTGPMRMRFSELEAIERLRRSMDCYHLIK